MSTRQLNTPSINHEQQCYLVSAPLAAKSAQAIGDFMTVGRDPSNSLVLQDPYASSRHARIEKRDQYYLLRDLRSRNGTFVNGARISECYLAPSDRITFGTSEFVFSLGDGKAPQEAQLHSKNAQWQKQLDQLPSLAQTDFAVLILGPSGTGKEVLANTIHGLSKRPEAPLISVNCSALSESLIESELFGHQKGSFTGATHDRKGAFEAARGGTLFLDEIGDLPLNLQPKLLRALENAEIKPVGSDRTVKTDVRIIAATHQSLEQKVKRGEFRGDLFFRLNVIKLRPPSLQDRMEDFEDLLIHFARQMRVRFSLAAIAELKRHSWPGNVRELKNAVARASACFPGLHIQPEHVAFLIDQQQPEQIARNANLPVMKEIEREMIQERLRANRGNQRRTALELGMPKSTLHDRIKSYQIEVSEN